MESNIWLSSSIIKTKRRRRITNNEIKSEIRSATNDIVENDANANGRRMIKTKIETESATGTGARIDGARRRRARLRLRLLLLVAGWRRRFSVL